MTAVVRDAEGVRIPGARVVFRSLVGRLASGDRKVIADEAGVARDFLTTEKTAQVVVTSGSAEGQVIVSVRENPIGRIALTATSTTAGKPPLSVSFQVFVGDAVDRAVGNQLLSVVIVDDPGAFPAPLFPITDAFGMAKFEVENITVDGTRVVVSAERASSNPITVSVGPSDGR